MPGMLQRSIDLQCRQSVTNRPNSLRLIQSAYMPDKLACSALVFSSVSSKLSTR